MNVTLIDIEPFFFKSTRFNIQFTPSMFFNLFWHFFSFLFGFLVIFLNLS